MAAVIRDQTDLLAEWLLWHLLLGISKVLLYDNNSRDPAALRMVAAPFVEAGALVLLPWPQQCQTCAYDAAIADPATLERVEFDFNAGQELGVNSTPTFFLEGEQLQLQQLDDLENAIEAAVNGEE